jgi:hypothetical protein
MSGLCLCVPTVCDSHRHTGRTQRHFYIYKETPRIFYVWACLRHESVRESGCQIHHCISQSGKNVLRVFGNTSMCKIFWSKVKEWRIYSIKLRNEEVLCMYKGAYKSLARPNSWCILFDCENISFDASLVIYICVCIYIYIYSNNIPPIMIINRIYETENLLSLKLCSFLVGLRTYQHFSSNIIRMIVSSCMI